MVTPDGTVNFLRALHADKAFGPICVTVDGTSNSSKEEQFKKLESPIEVTAVGVVKVTFFNAVQPLNELSSIFVTDDGIVTSASDMHDSNVLSLISVSAGESVTCLRDVHP